MIKDSDIEFTGGGLNQSIALVWIIDQDCLYDIAVKNEYVDMFLHNDQVIDVSENYLDWDGITVKFIRNNENIGELQTSEYFGSILLSNPLVLKLQDFPYGRYVVSPHAKFDGEKFIPLNRDIETLSPWYPFLNKDNNV